MARRSVGFKLPAKACVSGMIATTCPSIALIRSIASITARTFNRQYGHQCPRKNITATGPSAIPKIRDQILRAPAAPARRRHFRSRTIETAAYRRRAPSDPTREIVEPLGVAFEPGSGRLRPITIEQRAPSDLDRSARDRPRAGHRGERRDIRLVAEHEAEPHPASP